MIRESTARRIFSVLPAIPSRILRLGQIFYRNESPRNPRQWRRSRGIQLWSNYGLSGPEEAPATLDAKRFSYRLDLVLIFVNFIHVSNNKSYSIIPQFNAIWFPAPLFSGIIDSMAVRIPKTSFSKHQEHRATTPFLCFLIISEDEIKHFF